MKANNNRIAIVGAGLAGCTAALLLKQKGYDVHVFEKKLESNIGNNEQLRSINLFLSKRAEIALTAANVWSEIKEKCQPVIGRYYHLLDGERKINEIQLYSLAENEVNYSIMRGELNAFLYNKVKDTIGDNLKVDCTVLGEDLDKGLNNLKENYGCVICADGLEFNKSNWLRAKLLNDNEYEYTRYECSYIEIEVDQGEFEKALEYNRNDNYDYLHILSLGNKFMIIILPNKFVENGFHNGIIFFPNKGNINTFVTDESINEDNYHLSEKSIKNIPFSKWSEFLKGKFGDKNETLAQNFLDSCKQKNVTISKLHDLKCDRWIDDNLLMIGDSSHAVLPFHGQGANAAMEDAMILCDLLPEVNEADCSIDWQVSFEKFFKVRKPDADGLLELAREYHFSLLGDKDSIDRTNLALELSKQFPEDYESEYHMVTFNNKSYRNANIRYTTEKELLRHLLNYEEELKNKILNNSLDEGDKNKVKDYIYKFIHCEEALVSIKKNYTFQNQKEVSVLLQGLASTESKGVTYWDYIETDTLLSLQKPKTNYPDEIIFITYHQLCELYFKLIIQEIERLFDFYKGDIKEKAYQIPYMKTIRDKAGKIVGTESKSELETWEESLGRVDRYMQNLITSFDILKKGLSTSEFLEFRKVLLPASGFQTYQFRQIEIMLTPLRNLTAPFSNPPSENKEDMYWRKGAINVTDKKASKLLVNFNNKYDKIFYNLVDKYMNKTVWDLFQALRPETKSVVKIALRKIEDSILLWKIAHLHMIYEHIPSNTSATGGTDYTNYLPQLKEKNNDAEIETIFNKHSQVIYFPELWGKSEDHQGYIKKLIDNFPSIVSDNVKNIFSGDNPTQTKRL